MIEIIHILLLLLDKLHSPLRIINKGAEGANGVIAESIAEELRHYALDIAGSILDDMLEGLIFAVHVGHEVFSTLREIKNSLQVDNFGTRSRYGAEILGKKVKKSALVGACGH